MFGLGSLTSLTGGGGMMGGSSSATSGHAAINAGFEFAPQTGGSGFNMNTALMLGALVLVVLLVVRK